MYVCVQWGCLFAGCGFVRSIWQILTPLYTSFTTPPASSPTEGRQCYKTFLTCPIIGLSLVLKRRDKAVKVRPQTQFILWKASQHRLIIPLWHSDFIQTGISSCVSHFVPNYYLIYIKFDASRSLLKWTQQSVLNDRAWNSGCTVSLLRVKFLSNCVTPPVNKLLHQI